MARYDNGQDTRQCQMCDIHVRDEDLSISRMEHHGLKDVQALCPNCSTPMAQYIRMQSGENYWVRVTLTQEYIEDHRDGKITTI